MPSNTHRTIAEAYKQIVESSKEYAIVRYDLTDEATTSNGRWRTATNPKIYMGLLTWKPLSDETLAASPGYRKGSAIRDLQDLKRRFKGLAKKNFIVSPKTEIFARLDKVKIEDQRYVDAQRAKRQKIDHKKSMKSVSSAHGDFMSGLS